jgi:hypothetical protein
MRKQWVELKRKWNFEKGLEVRKPAYQIIYKSQNQTQNNCNIIKIDVFKGHYYLE